jgi:hypothetical protein
MGGNSDSSFISSAVGCAFVASAASLPSLAQAPPDHPLCVNTAETRDWSPDLDAVKAAPANHKVIFENDELRVLEVTVRPGEREQLHHHRWPSVMVLHRRPTLKNYDRDGNEIRPGAGSPAATDLPFVARLPAQAAHAVHVLDAQPFHAIRVEFKKLCPL